MKAIIAVILVAVLLPSFATAQRDSQPSSKFTQRVIKEVQHQILMLPYYGVFDAIGFRVDGYNVTLFGHVAHATLKSDAEHALKGVEGIEKINNQIEILPPSPMDDRLRFQLSARSTATAHCIVMESVRTVLFTSLWIVDTSLWRALWTAQETKIW